MGNNNYESRIIDEERGLIWTFLENYPDFFYFKDIKGRFKYISKHFCKFFGCKKKDIIGKTDLKFFPEEVVKQMHKEDLHVINTGIPLINKEESAKGVWFLTTKIPWFDNKGNKKGMFGISRDITECKQLEVDLKIAKEEIEEIFNFSPDMIGSGNLDGYFTKINPSFGKILGYKEEEFLKNAFLFFVHDDDIEKTKEALNDAVKGKRNIYVENRYRCKDGSYKWIEWKVISIVQEYKFIAVGRDITERKFADQKLKESEENYRNLSNELEQLVLERTKELKESEARYRDAYEQAEFYKDLFAHDISNILQNIKTSLALLSMWRNQSEKTEKINEIMKILNEQIVRGSKLVSNIRKLSQISEAMGQLEPIEMVQILKDAINFVNKSYPINDINIEIDSHIDEIFVQANELLLDVFENILVNAIKYNINPKIEILTRISKEIKNGIKYIKIEFIDNGIGVEDIMKEKIFGGIAHRKEKVHGMGLGLLLVKKIIENFNGQIWVEDKIKGAPSQGSNFILLIPEVI